MTWPGGPKSPRKRVATDELTETKRLRQLRKALKELDKFAASLPPQDDSAPLIRADRER